MQAVRKIHALKGLVYYCDTDSIVTDTPLPNSFLHDSELGKWKLEYELTKAFFIAPKCYAMFHGSPDQVVAKCKGVPHALQMEALYPLMTVEPKMITITLKDRFMRATGGITIRDMTKRLHNMWDRRIKQKIDQVIAYRPFKTLDDYLESRERFVKDRDLMYQSLN